MQKARERADIVFYYFSLGRIIQTMPRMIVRTATAINTLEKSIWTIGDIKLQIKVYGYEIL
jgi:hypothetical protein